MAQKYQKKALIIEALQYDKNMKHIELQAFMPTDDSEVTGKTGYAYMKSINQQSVLYIKTLEGDMKVSHGDYIIKGIKGEFYPCKPDVFKKTYKAL